MSIYDLFKFICRVYLFCRISDLQNHCETPKMVHEMLIVQAYLIILQFTILHSADTLFCFVLFFNKLKIYGNPSSNIYWNHFSKRICSLSFAVSHVDNSCSISNIFITSCICYGDVWPVILMLLLQLFRGAMNCVHIRWWT